MDILGYVSAFLGGGFITAMLFVVGYSNKIATMTTKLESLTIALNNHVSLHPQPICPMHQALSETVAVLKERAK